MKMFIGSSSSAVPPQGNCLLIKALRVILEDKSFEIKTPATVKARESAQKFLEWCLGNSDSVEAFSKQLTESLQTVICNSVTKSFRYNKEKLWREFYLLRCSKEFIKQWTDFLPTTTPPIEPIIYQHLTDVVLKFLLQDYFKIEYLNEEAAEMNENERNALHYVAGYVCRKLRTKIERENHKLKEEMILCLMDLVKDQNPHPCGADEEWTNLVDRGGLWHVKSTTYQLFCAIECQIREVLSVLLKPSPPSKVEMIKTIVSNEDVQFYWLIATAEFEIDDKETLEVLLAKIVQELLTIRGFSKAGAWMEKFKQTTKKPTQRARSL